MLSIKNLQAKIEENEILKGLNLEIGPGEVHAIMGPNGSGKSTLASVLAGREEFEVTGGGVEYLGKDLLEMAAEERAREGIFLAFQYPVSIPGVTMANFLRVAVNAKADVEKSVALRSPEAGFFIIPSLSPFSAQNLMAGR